MSSNDTEKNGRRKGAGLSLSLSYKETLELQKRHVSAEDAREWKAQINAERLNLHCDMIAAGIHIDYVPEDAKAWKARIDAERRNLDAEMTAAGFPYKKAIVTLLITLLAA